MAFAEMRKTPEEHISANASYTGAASSVCLEWKGTPVSVIGLVTRAEASGRGAEPLTPVK